MPVDLLAESASDLEQRTVVEVLLAQGEQLRDEDVVDGSTATVGADTSGGVARAK